jgi:hypothetical protein
LAALRAKRRKRPDVLNFIPLPEEYSMTTITFDTHQFIKDLQARGFNPEQAEGISDALKNVMIASEVATSNDMRELRSDIEKLELRIKAELSALKWMVSVTVAGIVSLVLKTFF